MIRLYRVHLPFHRIRLLFALIFLSIFTSKALLAQSDYAIGTAKDFGDIELINRGETLRGFRLHPYTGAPYQSNIDTMALDYYRRKMVEGKGLAMGYTGNLISPRHFKTFFDRQPDYATFSFGSAYQGILYHPDNLLFYNTKSPYTNMLYQRNGTAEQREEELDMTMAVNLGKAFNFGGDFNYSYSRGQYIANHSSGVSYRLFASVLLPRYELFTSAGNNYIKQNENGGLAKDGYIDSPQEYGSGRTNISSIEMPVKYSSGVGNAMWVGHIMLAHRYNLGSLRDFRRGSTLPNGTITERDTALFVPVGSIGHRFSYDRGVRLFIAQRASSLPSVYGQTYNHLWRKPGATQDTLSFHPLDSTRMVQFANTFSLSLREGFRPWVKMGLTGYARLENRAFYVQDSIPGKQETKEFATYIGGRVERHNGTGLNFDAGGEIAVLGADIGSMRFSGNVSSQFSLWGVPIGIEADARFHFLRVPHLWRHHHGSYVWWDNEFGFTKQLVVGGKLSAPQWGTELSLHSATLANTIYFDTTRRAQQYAPPIEILEGRLKHRYHWGILGWQAEVAYQLSSNQEVMPLPTLAAYGSLYLDFYTARVMRTQLGIDCHYHTQYYAPYYEPAVQQFINQQEVKIGNFPLLNLFANFKLRRVRFFVMLYNAGEMLIQPSKRWSLAHYPVNPMTLRLGINFDFNN